MRKLVHLWTALGLSLLPIDLIAQSQTLWSSLDGDPATLDLAQISRLEHLDTSQAIHIDADLLSALEQGQQLRLDYGFGQAVTLTVNSVDAFANGDTSWHAANGSGSSLILTASRNALSGSLRHAGNRFQLRAIRVADSSDYQGWLYSYRGDLLLKPHDQAGIAGKSGTLETSSDSAALSGSDVTIEQSLSASNVQIGEQITVEVAITNNLATTISNENVTVYFVLDDSNLVSLDSQCNTSTSGSLNTIECLISSLSPGASFEFSYTVSLTESAYPYTSSSVFVGDVFDQSNHVRDDAFILGLKDTLTDTDGDGISDFNEELTQTDPLDINSTTSAEDIPIIDLMFLYTDRYLDELGPLFPETEINHLVSTVNSYYLNSGALVNFRPIYYGLVNFDFQDSLDVAYDALSQAEGAFANTLELRDQLGADIVVLMDGPIGPDDTCGVGSLPGRGFNGELFHPNGFSSNMYVALYAPGFGDSGGCDEQTLAHELGHNLGMAHSRRDSNAEGTLPWAHGYGIDGQFVTIMAYASRFSGAESLPLFSSPDSSQCNGMACGINRNDMEQGADVVHALNHTRFQVANSRQSRVLNVSSLNPEAGSALIMFGGASSNGTDKSTFSASESIDVSATLNIPSEHVGESGATYVVISVPGAGFFYVDDQGAYQSWDGSTATLGSYNGGDTLNASEELVAFADFVPANFGVSGVSVQVFFAYAVSNTDIFVYSSEGVSFTIQ